MKGGRAAAAVLVLCLALSLPGCGKNESAGRGEPPDESGDARYPACVLTKEQMLQDYDAMWAAMEENYPFFGVLERRYGPGHAASVRAAYRRELETMTLSGDDAMFQYIDVVASSLYEACGTVGHVSIVNPNAYRGLDVYNQVLDEMPEVQPWCDVVNDPQVAAAYVYYEYLVDRWIEGTGMAGSSEEPVKPPEAPNLTTDLLDGGRTAYIGVRSFDHGLMAEDLPRIRSFLEGLGDCGDLIIDIRENGGGDAAYWEEAFVAPNLSRSVTTSLVRLLGGGPLAQAFYGGSYIQSGLSMDAVKADPGFAALNREDMERLTMARTLTDTQEPELAQPLFGGKIWLLTGPGVYSSSKLFAVFCKTTQFATLVGETTGGSDSGGPILYMLPNSGFLIQFDVEYCLNADGSCSQERGTVPAVETDDALGTVLELIRAGRNPEKN